MKQKLLRIKFTLLRVKLLFSFWDETAYRAMREMNPEFKPGWYHPSKEKKDE